MEKTLALYVLPRSDDLWPMYERGVDAPYRWLKTETAWKTADVVVFDLPGLTSWDLLWMCTLGRQLKHARNQVWVSQTLECDLNWRRQRWKPFLDLFDLHMSYRQDADVPMSYIQAPFEQGFRCSVPAKVPGHLMCAWISSNVHGSGRREYLSELMRHAEVHSYGRLFRNRDAAEPGFPGGNKRKVCEGYKFTLAFENAVAPDYVTEKFFQPFLSGSVPIYLGAPNIEEFAPGDHCFINVRDFPSPADLAAYIQELDSDDAAYSRYFDWKNQPYRSAFVEKLDRAKIWTYRQLCLKLDAWFSTGPASSGLPAS